jgi:uncharacterized membrane protein
MTLDQLLAKFEGVLLSAPLLRADLLDMVQDERDSCANIADRYYSGVVDIGMLIRTRNEKEVG